MAAAVPRGRIRTDAARNAERIVAAAWQTFTEHGADAQLGEIARRAGVGPATLYRHFANKDELARAVLQWRFSEDMEPVIERALQDTDPWHGMVMVWEAALNMAIQERHILSISRNPVIAADLADRFNDALAEIVHRAQVAKLVRADISRDDLLALTMMLLNVAGWGGPTQQGWRRYLVLLMDAMRPQAATPLPPI
jgi:AcrR family transcriptional regulator